MSRDAFFHLVDDLAGPGPYVALEGADLAAAHLGSVFGQFASHRRAAVAGEMAELHTRLLDLAAQRDGAFRFRQPPTAQDVVASVEQCADPGSAIGPGAVGEVAADDALEAAFPRAQPISAFDVGVRQPLPQQTDKLIQPRLTQIRRGRRADPLHMLIPRRVFRQQRPVRGQHLAPVAVRVDLRHDSDDEIGVVGRHIDERTVGIRQRSDRGHGEHHRGGRVRGAQFVGLNEGVLG